MKRASQLLMFVGLMLLVSAQAQAQMLKWEGRVFLNVNYAKQNTSTTDISSSSSFTKYDETGQLASTQTIESGGGMLDFAAGVRLVGNFGLGAGFNTVSTEGAGTITAKVPHPIFYDQPRTATAQVSPLQHKETAFHVMGLFVLPLSSKFDVTLSAGPTFFSLEQDTLSAPQVGDDVAPYTTVTLTNVTKVSTKTSKVGFNAGLDATFRVTKFAGLGAFVRYAGTSIEFTPSGGTALKLDVGGLQFGGGLRLRF